MYFQDEGSSTKSVFTNFSGFYAKKPATDSPFTFLANFTNPTTQAKTNGISTFTLSPSNSGFKPPTSKPQTSAKSTFDEIKPAENGTKNITAENIFDSKPRDNPFEKTKDSNIFDKSKENIFDNNKSKENIFEKSKENIFDNKSNVNVFDKSKENQIDKAKDNNLFDNKSKDNAAIDKTKGSLFDKSNEYYSNLKALNESVSQWIKTHVDKNPFCILTPIFRDYERYLKEIEGKQEKNVNEEKKITFGASTNNNKNLLLSGDNLLLKSTTFGSSTTTTTTTSTNLFSGITTTTPTFSSGTSSFSNSAFKTVITTTNSSTPSVSSNALPTFSSSSSSLIFGQNKPETTNIFGQKSDNNNKESSPFSAKNSSSDSPFNSNKPFTAPPTGFSFGSGTPFSFTNVAKPADKPEEKEPEEEEPPKAEFTPVVEEDHVFSKRCKVFVKKDSNFTDRGVGQLFLKPITGSEKVQLIVRADTNIGNLLLNFILSDAIPTQRMGKNNVMLVCIPMPDAKPPPVPILLRVKTSEEADDLLKVLEQHKK